MESSKVSILGKITGYSVVTTEEVLEVIIPEDVKLPDDSPARMKTIHADGKKWYLTVVYHEATDQPFALFCHTNHADKTTTTSDAICRLFELARSKQIKESLVQEIETKVQKDNNVSKLTRAVSLLLRHGVLPQSIVLELDKMEDVYVGSFLFQLKKFLGNYIKDGEVVKGDVCSDCGGTLHYSEGCMSCIDCGSSKCS